MPELILDAMSDVAEDIRVFRFVAADGVDLPDFDPGAHVDFNLGDAGLRSYSLIRWPGEDVAQGYEVAVKREEDGHGGSIAMHALKAGARVEVSEPSNDFELVTDSTPVLLLAGGIGITPIISMATQLKAEGRRFALHYAARSAKAMAFSDRLNWNFNTEMRLHFDDVVPLDLSRLMSEQPRDTALYICGPRGMIDAARGAAEAAGITNIHIELFTSAEPTANDATFEVEINDGRVFTISPGRSIIEVLEAEGVDLMYDCQRGDCGICQTDVISGTPDHRDVVLSEDERASGKVMQICVSRAKSERLVLDI